MDIKFEEMQSNFVKIGTICDIIDAIEFELSCLRHVSGMEENKHLNIIEGYLDKCDELKKELYRTACSWFCEKYWEDKKICQVDKMSSSPDKIEKVEPIEKQVASDIRTLYDILKKKTIEARELYFQKKSLGADVPLVNYLDGFYNGIGDALFEVGKMTGEIVPVKEVKEDK